MKYVAMLLLVVFVAMQTPRKVTTVPTVQPMMADLVLYGPGDWFVYYLAGRAISWAYSNWNNPNATRNTGPGALETDGCVGSQCPVDAYNATGGGGGW
jgi:hypothetical protein